MAEKDLKQTAYTYSDLAKLNDELSAELDKPSRKQNIDKIMELSSVIADLEKEENKEAIAESKAMLYEKTAEKERKNFGMKRIRPVIALCCIMVVVFTANTISVSAWNMNIFSLIVELTQGGVKIDFNNQKEEEIILPTSDDDPYGIIAKCVEDGITIETPHYLPEGFKLTTCETETPEENKFVVMTFKKGTELISFSFEAALDGPVGIPSDKHNISETTINGHTAIISKEDNQMIAVFKSGDFMFTMFTQDVDYAECDKILNSIR